MTATPDSLESVSATQPPGPLEVAAPARRQVRSVAWFAGICLALAALAFLPQTPSELLPFVLALGPAFVASGLARAEGGNALGRLWRSVVRRPTDARWYLVLLLPIAWALAVAIVAVAMGEPATDLFDELSPAALIIPLVVLIPAFAEEIAWRGFAVPRLLSVMSPLAASLLLAVPWTAIHLVLLLPGQMNEGSAIFPSVLSLFAYSVILTWIFVGSGGSVLLTGLVHTGLNGVVPLMWGVDADLSWMLRAVIAAVIAVAVVAFGGFRRTARAS